MKRLLALCLTLCLLLCACGGEKTLDIDINVRETGLAEDEDSGELGAIPAESAEEGSAEPKELDLTLGFAGDIQFDSNESVMKYYAACGNDLTKCIDPEYITLMNDVDLMWINNEFPYSDRGTMVAGKSFNFRASTDKVSLLQELGIDVANLGNNHIYDYGEEALEDTLNVLDEAGIAHCGAGMNYAQASAPLYMTVGDVTVAYCSAYASEPPYLTPEAGEDTPGIMYCFDDEAFCEEIREAAENADIVIAVPHWGTENTTVLNDNQLTTSKDFIDAGADVIIGTHAHCLQGIDYYEGAPILYNLGNFWFSAKTIDTVMVVLHISGTTQDPVIDVELIPGTQANCTTMEASTDEERTRILDYMEDISDGAVTIDEDGFVHEA